MPLATPIGMSVFMLEGFDVESIGSADGQQRSCWLKGFMRLSGAMKKDVDAEFFLFLFSLVPPRTPEGTLRNVGVSHRAIFVMDFSDTTSSAQIL